MHAEERSRPITFHKGEVLPVEPNTVGRQAGPRRYPHKGGNALDAFGNVGVIMVNPTGGTMGAFYMGMKARGLEIIYPVGLEKLIPSVEEAAQYGGTMAISKAIGCKAGMACVATEGPSRKSTPWRRSSTYRPSTLHRAAGAAPRAPSP